MERGVVRGYAGAMGKERSVLAIILMVIGAITVVVVAIAVLIPLVSGFRHGDDRRKMFSQSRVDKTRIKLSQYAFEAFPQWAASHPDKECPDKLSELDEYMNSEDTNDSWGHPIKMLCGANLPPGVKGVGVMSLGEDGREGTGDDLRSWD